jgi:hypothetical protein
MKDIMTRRKPRRRIPPLVTLDAVAVDAIRKALRWAAAMASGFRDCSRLDIDPGSLEIVATLVELRSDLALGRLEQAEREAESKADAQKRLRSVKTRKTATAVR